MKIAEKTVLITGAAGDLGAAVINSLLEAGAAKIFALDINQEKLASIKDPRVLTICCDASDFDKLYSALEPLAAVDILINGAGILHSSPLVNILDKSGENIKKAAVDWQRCININLSSVFYVTQSMAKKMVQSRTRGVIINISSVSAAGNAGQSAYSASKAGVDALTKVWSKELSGMGIRTVSIAPGYIDTASTRKAVSEAQLSEITAKIPMKKLGESQSIVQAIFFAIENDYVNGTIIEVDGGLVI